MLDEFSQYPLAQAQVARIVKEADIARGAFYKYFDDLTDAYNYLYHQAISDIHVNLNPGRDFDVDTCYKMVAEFIDATDKSDYRNLIKMHITKNEAILNNDPKYIKRMAQLDASMWSAMTLSHEAIRSILLTPEDKELILKRYRQGLELLRKGMS